MTKTNSMNYHILLEQQLDELDAQAIKLDSEIMVNKASLKYHAAKSSDITLQQIYNRAIADRRKQLEFVLKQRDMVQAQLDQFEREWS